MRPRLGSIRQIAETTILTPRIEPEKEDSSRCTSGSSLNFERRICDLTRSRETFEEGGHRIGVRQESLGKEGGHERGNLKPSVGTQQRFNSARKGWPAIRKRVLRGGGAIHAAKRRQRVCGPWD
jgi:hypothetical protein